MPFVNIVLFIFMGTKLELPITYFNKCVYPNKLFSFEATTFGLKFWNGKLFRI